jgi:hypothetical protein
MGGMGDVRKKQVDQINRIYRLAKDYSEFLG